MPSAIYVEGQTRTTFGTVAGSLGISSATALVCGNLDFYRGIRVLLASSGPASAPYSFSVQVQQGHNSGTWLVSTTTNVSTSAQLEYAAFGRTALVTITNAASIAYLQGAVYGLVV